VTFRPGALKERTMDLKQTKNLLQTKIAARVMFYFGVFGLALSALSVNVPDWKLVGATPLGFLKASDTCFLMCIAIMLAHLVDASARNAAPEKKE
jgi:hypothetical protein